MQDTSHYDAFKKGIMKESYLFALMNYRLRHGMYIINKQKLNDRYYYKMMVYNKKYKNTNYICCEGIDIINKHKNIANVYMFGPTFLLTSSFYSKQRRLFRHIFYILTRHN